MVKLLNMVLMISLILISLYIYADERILSGIIKKSSLNETMIKSNSISSLLTLGEMYQKGLGVEKDLLKAQKYYRVAMNYVKSSEDVGFLHNTDNLPDYEETEVSEVHHESSFDSTSENTNIIEKSEPEKDTD
ncbi:MAG: SEL1-like repeat protein, partial [Thiohalomonadales bacterium]